MKDTQEICDRYTELKMIPVYFDAYKEETYKSMIDTIIDKEGRLDILVNNYRYNYRYKYNYRYNINTLL